jgi:hypothetical protein
MEVHAHTHTSRKKWTHYLWEFLMLFLAVTLGFFVENQREHFIEKKREKEYIRSMIDDLGLDTAGYTGDNSTRSTAIEMFDSVILLLNKKNRTEFEQQRLYYAARMGLRLAPFPKLNDRTFEQMKSSGNLRLIHNTKIADRVTKYYFNAKEFLVNTDQTLLRLQSLIEIHGKIFDGAVFREMVDLKQFIISPPGGNPGLITENKETLNELSVRIHYVLSILLYSQNFTVDLNKEAAELIRVLKEQYRLK